MSSNRPAVRLLLLLAVAAGCLAAAPPLPAPSGGWESPRGVDSLLEALHLPNSTVFHLDFEKDAKGGIRFVWLATADGLYRYDGFAKSRYGTEDGLPSNFVRSVLVSSRGELWVGTDKGAGVFSKGAFDRRGSEAGLAGPNVRRIIEDRQGTLWFASDSWPDRRATGGLASLKAGKWRSWSKKDGLPNNYVVDEFTDSSGRYFALTIDGPARLRGDRWTPEPFSPLPSKSTWSSAAIVEIPGVGVVLSNGSTVWALRDRDTWSALGSPPEHLHGIASTRDGKLLIAGSTRQSTKAFFEWTGSEWKQVSSEFHAPQGWGIYLREAPDGSIWYAGVNCLERWPRLAAEWQYWRGPESRHFLDANDALWSYGKDGRLAEFVSNRWQPRGTYTAYAPHRDGSTWVAQRDEVTRWNAGSATVFHEGDTGIQQLLGVQVDARGAVWVIGNSREGRAGVAEYDGQQWQHREIPDLGRLGRIFASKAPDGGIWYLTRGLGEDPYRLTFVGETIRTIPVPETLVAYFVDEILATPDGSVLLYGETGLHRWKRGGTKWETIPSLPSRLVTSAAVLNNSTWLVLSGMLGGKDGLLRLDPDGTHQFFPTDEPLTVLTRAADGSLLSGSKGRFWIIDRRHDREPVAIFLQDETQQVVSVNRDRKGAFWIGTPQGLARFAHGGTPPKSRILAANDRILSGQPYIATVEAIARFGADSGLEHFYYSWSLDGGPWSPFLPSVTRRIEPGSITLGRHTIAVRSRDNALHEDPQPVESTFEVRPTPIQDQPWFGPGLLAATILMAFSTATAISARRKLARTSAVSLDISEKRNRLIIETAQEGIAVFNPDGICTMANREFARIVALPHDDVVGRHASTMLDSDVLDIMRRNTKAGVTGSYELPLQTRAGLRRLAVSGRALPASAGTPASTLVTFTDITAYRSAEDAIRRSELNYRLLFENSPNPRLLVHRETLHIVAVNQAACDLYGYSKEAFLRLSVFDLQLPENIEKVRALFSKPLEARPLHWRHLNNRGEIIPVDVYAHDHEFDGMPCRMVLIVDKTEQDRAADELRNSQAALAQAQRIAKIGSYEVRTPGPNGQKYERIWSDEMYELTGLDRATTSVEELNAAKVIHPDDQAMVDLHLARLLDEGVPFELDHRIVRANGEVRYTRTTAHRAMRGEQKTVIGTIQDITEQRVLQVQLQQSQRLDSIGRLAGGVAHDFNNLLTVINGYSKLILRRLQPGDRFEREIQQIAHAGEEAADLTKRLLAFGRKQVLKPAVLDLNEVVREAIPLLSRVCGGDIRLVTNLHDTPMFVRADLVQLNQLLLNLTTNARDAMPRGGSFTIETSEVVLNETFVATHPGASAGRHCQLSLSDTGIGIDQIAMTRIFEPFFTTKEGSGGTGLGLATVYGIVKQSGGYIEVSSEVGVGTRFDIYLPAVEQSSEPATAPPEVETAPLPLVTNRTLLLVEDQPEVRQFISEILVEAGYRVFQATNGPKALELYDVYNEQLDLLLTDVVMPGMTGPELVQAIADRGRRNVPLPVLFISGYAQGKLDANIQSIESVEVLEKPFSPATLLERISKLLHGSSGDK